MLVINMASLVEGAAGNLGEGKLALESAAFKVKHQSFALPPGGAAVGHSIELLSSAPFDLHCRLWMGGEKLPFSLVNLQDGDALNLVCNDVRRFTATIFHAAPLAAQAQCIARCANGDEAPGCVTCKSGKLTGKICC
jgi:hypothetical protein